MVEQAVILDLFCGAGGIAVGYSLAGYRVVGVDVDPQLAYPFEFYLDDALHVLRVLISGGSWNGYVLSDFAAIHASPPCQGYTALAAVHGNDWPRLIEPVRDLLDQTGLPYVIENVQGAPLRRDLTLCGEMFDLAVIRHRYFELGGWSMLQPKHVKHRGRVAGWRHGKYFDGPYFAVYGEGGGKGTVDQWRKAMGIRWMSERHDLAEAIPPAYSHYIGLGLRGAFA